MSFFKPEDFANLKDATCKRYAAEQANRTLLERGTRVYGLGDMWEPSQQPAMNDTHQALLVCIEPLAKESPEEVLREMVGAVQMRDKLGYNPQAQLALDHLLDRARRCLERK